MPSKTWPNGTPDSMPGETNSSPPEIKSHVAGLVRWLLGDLVQDIVGIAVGDWVHEMRIRNLLVLRNHTDNILKIRELALENRQVDPEFVRPLLKAAATESDDEMLKLWAELLATSLDPSKAALVRRSFIELLQQLDAIDARVLKSIGMKSRQEHGVSPLELEEELGCHHFHIVVSLQHLERLRCVRACEYAGCKVRFDVDDVGKEILRALDPVDSKGDA